MSDAESRPSQSEPLRLEDWRRLVRKALGDRDPSTLRSRTRDDIVVEPLYTSRTDCAALDARGAAPWSVVQIIDNPDPDDANRQALTDLDGGADGLSLRFAGAPTANGLGLPLEAAALRIALEGIDLTAIHLRLEPHPRAAEITTWLTDLVEGTSTAPELTHIAFGLDPVTIAAGSEADTDPDPTALAALIRDLSAARFKSPLAIADGRSFHEAGATEAQELAGILSAAVWWLRAADAAGMSPSETFPVLSASVSVDQDQFLSIAKLRALRLLWARLQELCNVERKPLALHAETGRRMLTRVDIDTNLLRTTLAAFAAAIGGADAITVLPHTAALGRPDSNAGALARNIQRLLIDEAHVHRVADASAGAGAVEALTEALAERAWSAFQAIEREGGIVASLRAGAFPARIAEARAALERSVADSTTPLIGATLHPAPASEDTTATSPLPEQAETLAALGLAPIRLEDFAKAAA